MAALISTQRAAQEARSSTNICYICGDALPQRGSPAWKEEGVIGDHVIPSAILSMAPSSPSNDWPLILDIHGKCEREHKRHRDQFAKVMQLLGSAGPRALSAAELGLVRNRCNVAHLDVAGQSQRVLENVDDAQLAVHLWVRGAHAALYGEVLPSEVGQLTRPPAPIYTEDLGDPLSVQASETQILSGVLGTVNQARARGLVDKLELRGGAVLYECTWMEIPADPEMPEADSEPWWCFWALDLPGCPEWALRTRGSDAPWYGTYCLPQKPALASAIPLPLEYYRNQ